IKERAGFFLLEMGNFKPFRVILQADSQVIDTINEAECSSIETDYKLLLNQILQDLEDENIKASAIVLTGKADGYDT
ncbi:hypothetical protein, partial [Brevibacillus sp. SIMBA_040]